MRQILQGFVVAFAMYSKIPMPKIQWTKENMKYCVCFFPLIGVVIGLLMRGWFWFSQAAGFGVTFRTCVLILIPVAVSGGIHLDGLLDTADALSSYKSREEKLEILKDSHAGAFAIIVGICYFVLSFGIYSEMTAHRLAVLSWGFALSRAFSGFGLVQLKKAKNTGLLRTFSDAAANRRVAAVMAVYIGAAVVLMVWAGGLTGGICAAGALLSFVWYRHMSYSKFGGVTGDLAGCFVQTAELVMALAVILCR